MLLLTLLLADGAPDLSSYAGRLRWAMDQAGKTNQSSLASEVGLRPQAIQYLVSPENQAVGSKHTAKLAAALGVDAQWLADGSGTPRPSQSDEVFSLLNSGPGTGKSLTMAKQGATFTDSAMLKTLEGWRAAASPKSREVIDRLSLLAQKNRLRDEDWQLIDDMVLRLAQQPGSKSAPTP